MTVRRGRVNRTRPVASAVNVGGDVVGGGTGDVIVTIPINTVTYAQIQDTGQPSILLGRGSDHGPGDLEEITLGDGLTMTDRTLSVAGGGLGGCCEPLTNGEVEGTELIFADGDVIMCETS